MKIVPFPEWMTDLFVGYDKKKLMTRILVKNKSHFERTSAAVCYVNLFFAEIYSATYFYKIRQNLFFFNHVRVLETNVIQWVLSATVQYDIFRIWLWYC